MVFRAILAALAMLLIVPSAAMAEKPVARVVILENLFFDGSNGLAALVAAGDQVEREFQVQAQSLGMLERDVQSAPTPEKKAQLDAILQAKKAEFATNYQRRQQQLFQPIMDKIAVAFPLFQASKGGSEIFFATEADVEAQAANFTIEDLSAEFAAWMNARP